MTIIFFLLAALAASVTFALGLSIGAAGRKPAQQLLGELAARDALIEDLRETAWDHREIDPHLATIVIDKIRTNHTRKELQ